MGTCTHSLIPFILGEALAIPHSPLVSSSLPACPSPFTPFILPQPSPLALFCLLDSPYIPFPFGLSTRLVSTCSFVSWIFISSPVQHNHFFNFSLHPLFVPSLSLRHRVPSYNQFVVKSLTSSAFSVLRFMSPFASPFVLCHHAPF